MNRLAQLYDEVTMAPLEDHSPAHPIEGLDALMESIEAFLDDTEHEWVACGLQLRTTPAFEGRLAKAFQGLTKDYYERLLTMLNRSENVMELFEDRLDALQRSLRAMDRNSEFHPKLGSIAPYFYDSDRQQIQFDLKNALAKDAKWIAAVIALIDQLDEAFSVNYRTYENAPVMDGPKAYKRYWVDHANKKLINAGLVFTESDVQRTALYGTTLAMAKGFDRQLQGPVFLKQGHPLELRYGKPKLDHAAKRDLEKPHSYTQRQILDVLRETEAILKQTTTVVERIKRYRYKYHPVKSPVFRSYAEIEYTAIKQLGFAVYSENIQGLANANRSIVKSMRHLPLRLLKRNLQLMKVSVRLCEQFTSLE